MKAMSREPDGRYASASELAADVRRHLHSEPVTASPLGSWYRFKKTVHRHRTACAMGATRLVSRSVPSALASSATCWTRTERFDT